MLRTHNCGELRKTHVGKKVTLCGWADTIRPLGNKLTFIDIRDRYGKTQIVVKGKAEIKLEYCIQVEGEVVARKNINKELPTGEIEISAKENKILNESLPLPFNLADKNIDEDLRLKYRFLDLRRESLKNNLILRHKLNKSIHDFMDKNNFVNIETPMLAKSTPEGARDYIVPSRVNAGKFYALPQSPQIFKQLMMVSNYDKYYQIARCFRDEDLRADRQPEFTQLDIEMSFGIPEDLQTFMEGLMVRLFKKCRGIDIANPFPRMSYRECVEFYGTDRPDLRFGMPLIRLDEIAQKSTFTVFLSVLETGGCVKAINVKGGGT